MERWMGWGVLSLCLVGCSGKSEDTAPPGTFLTMGIYEIDHLPISGWEPVRVGVAVEEGWRVATEVGRPIEHETLIYEGYPKPIIIDADGAEVPIEEAYDAHGRLYGWVGVDELPPGDYSITGFELDPVDEVVATWDLSREEWRVESYIGHPPMEFTVSPFGQSEAAGAALAPAVYSMTYEPWMTTHFTEGLWKEGVDDLWFEILEVSGSEILGRFIFSGMELPPCVALQDWFEVGDDGMVEWTSVDLVANTVPDPMNIHEPWFRMGFSEDASAIDGFELNAVLDTRGMSAIDFGDPDETVCTWSTLAELSCLPCPDEEPWCLPLRFHSGGFERSLDSFDDVLPYCGVNMAAVEVDTPEIELDFSSLEVDCGCAMSPEKRGVGWLLALGLLGLARRRSRLE